MVSETTPTAFRAALTLRRVLFTDDKTETQESDFLRVHSIEVELNGFWDQQARCSGAPGQDRLLQPTALSLGT